MMLTLSSALSPPIATARFIQAQTGAQANAGINTVRSPGLNVWNMSLFKNTKLTERFSLQFRAIPTTPPDDRKLSASDCPATTALSTRRPTPTPCAASYVNVDAGPDNFLNRHQFNGGSRTMQLGLRLIW